MNLAEDVVETAQVQHVRRRPNFLGCHPTALKVFAGVASLAVTISVGLLVVNRDIVRMPNWSTVVSKSVSDVRGPLDRMFDDRFNPEWTDALEASLLNEIVENRLLADRSLAEPSEIARFIFSNQQENITLATPRLSRSEIERIVKERKTS